MRRLKIRQEIATLRGFTKHDWPWPHFELQPFHAEHHERIGQIYDLTAGVINLDNMGESGEKEKDSGGGKNSITMNHGNRKIKFNSEGDRIRWNWSNIIKPMVAICQSTFGPVKKEALRIFVKPLQPKLQVSTCFTSWLSFHSTVTNS